MYIAHKWGKELGSLLFLVQVIGVHESVEGVVMPKTLVWDLQDQDGNIVNNRQDVVVSSLGLDNYILLSGADLAISSGEAHRSFVRRHLVVKATYDGDFGTDLPAHEMITFPVQNLNLGA